MRPASRDPSSEAGFRALAELLQILRDYREGVVLVGGWVPELAFPEAETPPVATIDIDLALDANALRKIRTKTLGQLLEEQGYRQGSRDPFRFEKDFQVQGRRVSVKVDLLTSPATEGAMEAELRPIQDVQANAMPGFEMAFRSFKDVPLSQVHDGASPGDTFRVVSPAAFLVLKGLALKTRNKNKDLCDIHYCLEHYPGGIETAAGDLRPMLQQAVVVEALQQIDRAFGSAMTGGPLMVAREEGWTDPDQRWIRQRVIHQRVRTFLEAVRSR